MLNATSAYAQTNASFYSSISINRTSAATVQTTRTTTGDSVQLGANPVSNDDAQRMVFERAMAKLQSVVSEARAALGLDEDAVVDTSPEATANRIADFALNFFSKYAENNGLSDNEEGRRQFADFIGGAIAQGISEARGILESLNALNGEVSGGIDKTANYIQARLDDFVKNGYQAAVS